MDARRLDDRLSVGPQLARHEVAEARAAGFRALIVNRPDGEGADQPSFAEIARAAREAGLEARHLPVASGAVTEEQATAFAELLRELPGPVLATCRTGTRSATLWALSQAGRLPVTEVLSRAKAAGIDLSGVARRLAQGDGAARGADATYDVAIVGAGAGGIAAAASLLARRPDLSVALIDPAEAHYYQPGWTLVGAGVFEARDTARTMASLIPSGATWIQAGVVAFEPEADALLLEGCRRIEYRRLVAAPGLKLDWGRIPGLEATLGRHGVTSNYRYDLAPYTWELVRGLTGGRAVFTQPPMPIKCAGAPQKAMYLSADAWRRRGVLGQVDIQFMTAGGVLFGVKEYVPALMEYVRRYDAHLNFFHNLVALDGPGQVATFEVRAPETEARRIEVPFDMIHVTPPQVAPDVVRASALADAGGWIDVDPTTLRHRRFANVWALGDATSAPNAKTAAAARKQAPVVAANLVADLDGHEAGAAYDGYGSCPLTVERGKIVLAEFGYGGRLLPSFPTAVIDGTRPSRLAWLLKERILPPVYWQGMLKGREWLARPEPPADASRPQAAP